MRRVRARSSSSSSRSIRSSINMVIINKAGVTVSRGGRMCMERPIRLVEPVQAAGVMVGEMRGKMVVVGWRRGGIGGGRVRDHRMMELVAHRPPRSSGVRPK